MNSADDREILLRAEHLCRYFKLGRGENKAVDDVSFDIRRGEVFGLVGESGSGKTTVARSVIGVHDITSGSIYFKGRRIAAGTRSYEEALKAARRELRSLKADDPASEKRRAELEETIALAKEEIGKARIIQKNAKPVTEIQMIFQDPVASLDPRMTVREIVAEGLTANGVRDRDRIDAAVAEVLTTVGLLPEHAGRYPHEFSGGQRQRIGIARSIIMKPELLIADEPVSALDVSVRAQVINLLNELRERMGLTVMFIAHDLSVVRYFSDRIGVMHRGRLVELAPSDELFAHPLHPYTRSLLSAIPIPDPRAEKKRRRIAWDPAAGSPAGGERFREIVPGHFAYCGDEEEKAFRKAAGSGDGSP